MSLLTEQCEQNKKNLGVVRCGELPALPRVMITTPDDFKLAPAAFESEAALKTALQAALIAGVDVRVYFWPNFVGFEAASEEAVYEQTALSDMFVRNGKYAFRFHIRKNLCLHKAMFSHSANSGRVFIIDVNNKMLGTEDTETGDIYGLSMSLINVEKLMFSDGTIATKTPIYVVLTDSNEIDQKGVLIPVPFINTLKRLTDVTVAQVDAATTSILTVSVKTTCDGVPVIGLLEADFIVKDAGGVAIVLTDFTDNGDGTYTLESGADFVDDGTVTLRAPSLLTVKAYEAIEPAVVEVT